MDKNKLKVLREIKYTIRKTCGTCKYGVFFDFNRVWGTCDNFTYQHAKHTGEPRQLSINKFGNCGEYKPDPNRIQLLETFQEFIEGS